LSRGKVYLVGTGPGDPELITIKAERIISSSDVLVYDDLIPPEIMGLANKNARTIYVGKRAGRHKMSQGEINSLLIQLAGEGKRVARLKGGDPCIFGRCGEEAAYLKKHGVDFEIIPGISSATAGPVSVGIPPTHRHLSSSLRVVTAHEDPTKEDSLLDWKNMAQDKGTIVFLMGASRIGAIAKRLIAEGMDKDRLCALVQDATTGFQRHVLSTLAKVDKDAKRMDIGSPCIMLVGDIAGMAHELFEPKSLPLEGMSVLITRPIHLAWESALRFFSQGARAYVYPLIEISELAFDIPDIESHDMFIFTSQNAVNLFMGKMLSSGRDSRIFSGIEIVAIGPSTAGALYRYGITADIVAKFYTAEGIIEAIEAKDLKGRSICIPRAKGARPYLVDALQDMGAWVTEIPVYESRMPANADSESFYHVLAKVDSVIFTSPSGAMNALELLGDGATEILNTKMIVTIGPITAGFLKDSGLEPDLSANTHTDIGIIEAMKGTRK